MKNILSQFNIYTFVILAIFPIITYSQNTSDVKIGTQIWTTKNLDVSTFRNGEAIPEAKNAEEWVKAGESKQPAWCYYDNDPKNSEVYGKLYNWYAVNDSRGLAPKGYHIPSDAEWTVLTDFLGGEDKAGKKMKSKTGWQGWEKNGKKSGNGTNSSGFNGLPVGNRYGMGPFFNVGNYGLWWSSTEHDAGNAWYRNLYSNSGVVNRSVNDREVGLSVRCLMDYKQESSEVYIGNQVWTSKNLDVSTFRNGEHIPEAKSKDEWIAAGKNKKAMFCYYGFDKKYGAFYGKLYNFYAVQDPRGLAPEGFHIPSDKEWTVLTQHLGGEDLAGYKMKSKAGWYESRNGNNSSFFNGLPGGICEDDGNFIEITETGSWWSSTETNLTSSYFRDLYYSDLEIERDFCIKNYGLSVRCIKD